MFMTTCKTWRRTQSLRCVLQRRGGPSSPSLHRAVPLQTNSFRMLGNFLLISVKVRKWKFRRYRVSGVLKKRLAILNHRRQNPGGNCMQSPFLHHFLAVQNPFLTYLHSIAWNALKLSKCVKWWLGHSLT